MHDILRRQSSLELIMDETSKFGSKFPYPVFVIATTWFCLGLSYTISRWREKPKNQYIIPRVFVLCSPRTVQFHYELILRIGLPSFEFNPDKHDIDITVLGDHKNEVVPMTRINTKTLLDDPLITSLSIIVYRLVEMPQLGYLVLSHSGPFKAWLYVYDFTVIDLSTNKEQYYALNQYIGSLNRHYHLEDSTSVNVHYPIDDVPLPQWSTDDIYLITITLINIIMLSISILPINCSYANDIASIVFASLNGLCMMAFLNWLLYYHSRWDSERREYFNIEGGCRLSANILRVIVIICACFLGVGLIYFILYITDWRESIVWTLAVSNTCILVVGIWNVARLTNLGEWLVSLGLMMRGIEKESVGMKYSELISDALTKSGSTSDDGGSSLSVASKIVRSIGPRSSVKSFGFDPITGHPSRRRFLGFPKLSQSNTIHGEHHKGPGGPVYRAVNNSVGHKDPHSHNANSHHTQHQHNQPEHKAENSSSLRRKRKEETAKNEKSGSESRRQAAAAAAAAAANHTLITKHEAPACNTNKKEPSGN